jgi:hypothetical protein
MGMGMLVFLGPPAVVAADDMVGDKLWLLFLLCEYDNGDGTEEKLGVHDDAAGVICDTVLLLLADVRALLGVLPPSQCSVTEILPAANWLSETRATGDPFLPANFGFLFGTVPVEDPALHDVFCFLFCCSCFFVTFLEPISPSSSSSSVTIH